MDVYCIRHGETEWSLSGQHTGRTDIPLTENGRRLAGELGTVLAGHDFELVLSSPLARARDTCTLAGLGERAEIEPDLSEWDYGDYESLTPAEIDRTAPGWMIFRDGCPHGEQPADLANRVDRLIARLCAVGGDVALFAHGHVLRVLAARWIGLPVEDGKRFLLNPGTLCILGHYHGETAIRVWNAARG